jgi:hypothetical protein
MKNYFLDHVLKVRLPIIVFVILATFAVTYYATYASRNNIGYQPDQPIAYSHKLHAGTLKIDCKYCHVGADKSRHAVVPTVSVCMGCHAVARRDMPEIQKLADYYEKGIALPWKRVHKTPEFAYFNHSSHVNKGIDCIHCHGDMTTTEKVGQVKSFTMGACLDCHRNAPERLKELKSVNKGPDYCWACHR